MEIQYEKFNYWKDQVNSLFSSINVQKFPEFMQSNEYLIAYLNGEIKELPENQSLIIRDHRNEFTKVSKNSRKIHCDITEEISFNKANISNDNQLKRYFSYLALQNSNLVSLLKTKCNYNALLGSKINPLQYENSTEYISTNLILATGSKAFLSDVKFKDDISDLIRHIHILVHTFETLQFLIVHSIEKNTNSSGLIVAKTSISPLIDDPILMMGAEEDVYKGWRLVIADPQRRKFFDKWSGKMKDVRIKITDNQKTIDEINGTNYKVGSGNIAFDKFIEWANNITYSLLPDQVFSHEIMNEIDHNLLELITRREKDLYLSKLAGELEACAYMFKGYTKTHPDYKSRIEEPVFNKETGEFDYVEMQKEFPINEWRELSKDRSKYVLQTFYINLLILEEVLNKIINYAKDKITPEEPITIDNELSAFNHRLLLLHKLNMFEPLYRDHYNTIGAGNFTKLIANMIGVPKESIDGFRAEIRKLISEISNPATQKKTVQTSSANSKVRQLLSEVGLIKDDL